jgi:hypothetical protein
VPDPAEIEKKEEEKELIEELDRFSISADVGRHEC